MAHSREDVLAAVRSAFPADGTDRILAALDHYGTEPHEREADRVQLAIVTLSEGSEAKLLELVKAAKTDYRDILSWAQTGPLSAAEGEELQKAARRVIDKFGRE